MATYTITRDNLASRSKEPNDAVVWEQEANTLREKAEVELADTKKRLAAAEGKKKEQGLLLETVQQTLSNREDSSVMMISTAVAMLWHC
jgi:hypothetical protein